MLYFNSFLIGVVLKAGGRKLLSFFINIIYASLYMKFSWTHENDMNKLEWYKFKIDFVRNN